MKMIKKSLYKANRKMKKLVKMSIKIKRLKKSLLLVIYN